MLRASNSYPFTAQTDGQTDKLIDASDHPGPTYAIATAGMNVLPASRRQSVLLSNDPFVHFVQYMKDETFQKVLGVELTQSHSTILVHME